MAQSDSAVVESIKTARDAIIAAIADGQTVVQYTIRGRSKTTTDPSATLLKLEELLQTYEGKALRGTVSPFRLAALYNAR